MASIYKLQVSFKPNLETHKRVSELLKVSASNNSDKTPSNWIYEIQENESEPYDFINKLLDLLEGKYDSLFKLGIERKDITIWFLYEYEEQCNMEFDAEVLRRLGENGVSLCISCWQKDSYIAF